MVRYIEVDRIRVPAERFSPVVVVTPYTVSLGDLGVYFLLDEVRRQWIYSPWQWDGDISKPFEMDKDDPSKYCTAAEVVVATQADAHTVLNLLYDLCERAGGYLSAALALRYHRVSIKQISWAYSLDKVRGLALFYAGQIEEVMLAVEEATQAGLAERAPLADAYQSIHPQLLEIMSQLKGLERDTARGARWHIRSKK